MQAISAASFRAWHEDGLKAAQSCGMRSKVVKLLLLVAKERKNGSKSSCHIPRRSSFVQVEVPSTLGDGVAVDNLQGVRVTVSGEQGVPVGVRSMGAVLSRIEALVRSRE